MMRMVFLVSYPACAIADDDARTQKFIDAYTQSKKLFLIRQKLDL